VELDDYFLAKLFFNFLFQKNKKIKNKGLPCFLFF
jgi:hypothetical protein